METLAKILAVICIVALAITIPLTVFAVNLGRTAFNIPLVKRIITDEVVNSDLIPTTIEWFSERMTQQRIGSGRALPEIDEPDIVQLLSSIDRSGWQRIKDELLTREMIAGWVSVTVDGFYGWIDSTDRVPQIVFDLEPLKERVDSKHGINAALVAYEYLEPCTQEQIDDFIARSKAAPEGSEVLYSLCVFPDPWRDDQLQDYIASIEDVVDYVPKSFALTPELVQLQDKTGIGSEVIKQQLRFIRTAARFAWIPPLLLLLILLLLRPAWSIGVRVGLPLLIGGGLACLPALLYRGMIVWLLSVGLLSEVPEVIHSEASRALLRLLSHTFKPMLIQSIIITAVGLNILILSAVMGKKSQRDEAVSV